MKFSSNDLLTITYMKIVGKAVHVKGTIGSTPFDGELTRAEVGMAWIKISIAAERKFDAATGEPLDPSNPVAFRWGLLPENFQSAIIGKLNS